MSEPARPKREQAVIERPGGLNKAVDAIAKPFWFSSATAGLIASLESVGAKGSWVGVPPNICPNVIAAIFGAGCQPWFIDIEPERQGMDPDRLAEVIGQLGAVIAIHAYGTPCGIRSIMQIASQAGVPVIEDCAQADGATLEGQEVGTFGDIAVFSFGKGKIVEADGGGLAIVCNPDWLLPMQALTEQWEPSSDTTYGDDLGYAYRFFYNRFYPGRTALAREPFFSLAKTLAPLCRSRCKPERIDELLKARSRRESLVFERRKKYAVYVEQLGGVEHITPVALHDGAAPWRFNAEVEAGRRNSVFRKLLAANINASTWYPRMTEFLPERVFRSTELPVAKHFERTLLNLWVDETVTTQDIVLNCAKLKQELVN